jgi:hypothetical protein
VNNDVVDVLNHMCLLHEALWKEEHSEDELVKLDALIDRRDFVSCCSAAPHDHLSLLQDADQV